MKHLLHRVFEKVSTLRKRFITPRISAIKFKRLLSAVNNRQAVSGSRAKSMALLINEAVTAYQSEFAELERWLYERGNRGMFPVTGQYDWRDSHVLYALIRHTKPEIVFEISPNYGYSTGVMLLAMNKNQRGQLFSFDLLFGAEEKALKNFKKFGIPTDRLTWFTNDCYVVLNKLAKLVKPSIDLLFMDSDHTFEFAGRYVQEIFPFVNESGLIHVHDVCPGAKDNYPYTDWPEVSGESVLLAEHLRRSDIPAQQFNYGATLLQAPELSEKAREILSEKPHYRDNFSPLSKERNYSFWMMWR